MQITGLQRLGTSIVLHNGDDLMRQMRASLRLLAAAHDSCLDGVAARRRSFLRGHLIFAFATFGWAITLHLQFGTKNIMSIRYGDC